MTVQHMDELRLDAVLQIHWVQVSRFASNLITFRTWFYFAVKGVERGKFLHFHIKNLNFQRSLYASGLKPFFRVGTEGKFRRV